MNTELDTYRKGFLATLGALLLADMDLGINDLTHYREDFAKAARIQLPNGEPRTADSPIRAALALAIAPQPEAAPSAFQVLKAALQADSDYAWSWHSNLAMASFDEGLDHQAANRAAARFMYSCFGIDTSKHERFPRPPTVEAIGLPESCDFEPKTVAEAFLQQEIRAVLARLKPGHGMPLSGYGPRPSSEPAPTACAQCKRRYRHGKTSTGCPKCAPGVLVPESEFEKPLHLSPCKGTNCGATDGVSHSAECFAEHEAAANPGGMYTPDEIDTLGGLPTLPEAAARLLPFAGGEA